MEKVYLSDTEKRILRHLSNNSFNTKTFPDLAESDIAVAIDTLVTHKFVNAVFASGHIACIANITHKGIVYLKENPELVNPASKSEINDLTKQNLVLQNNELIYKSKIRKQESIIRFWQLVSAFLGLLSLLAVFFK